MFSNINNNPKLYWHMRIVLFILSLLIVQMLAAGCKKGDVISDFNSDGCSLFPDRNEISRQDWCECCFQHDLIYWRGGTEGERLQADLELKECVIEKTGNTRLAELMYDGVRLGGSPYFYNWYRWGYGWGYDRKYQKLTEQENDLVQQKLAEYYEDQPINPCSEEMVSK